jgi:hypothetical protein
VLVFAAARYARGHVIRPIRIFGVLAIAGAAAAVLAFGRLPVPRAFLGMCACLALAFSVNRRPTQPPRWPALSRALWIAAAALMLAALPSDVPRAAGAFAFTIGEIELLLLVAAAVALLAAVVRLVRGIRADAGDRLLIGALTGIVAFVVLAPHIPPPPVWWIYPFALLLGAALARANGNLRRP